MRNAPESAARRAERLLRWYPTAWRERYGEEFAELLICDIDERPHSLARTVDVAGSGILARFTAAGLAGPVVADNDHARLSLAYVSALMAVFMAFGVGFWSQLMIGWQWAAPDTPVTAAAAVAMSAGVLVFVALTICAVLPVGWVAIRAVTNREARGLWLPLILVIAGSAVLVLGSAHFGNSWPGTGGRPWGAKHLVPGEVAAFGWGLTRSVTSYWAHPGTLSSFPPADIAWMMVSPIAMVSTGVGAFQLVRRVQLSPAVLRFEARLAALATWLMVLLLSAAGCWVIVGGPGPRGLFQTGIINVVGLIVMIAALIAAQNAAQRARKSSLSA